MKNFLKNYLSTISFILFAYFFYTHNNYYESTIFFQVSFGSIRLNILDAFNYLILFYIVILIPFYAIETENSKARNVIEAFLKKIKNKNYEITQIEKTSILAWCVKLFFVPLMIAWCIQNGANIFNKIPDLLQNKELSFENFRYFFDNYLFLTLYGIIIFVDVAVFAVGYITESKFLKNKIKSVEPTMLGWVVALICYPPFNSATEKILGWWSENFPTFSNTYVHLTINILILIAFFIYTRASIALGFKASNLTNRGIVTKGPYKYIRHPAYFCKNFARILGALPILIISIKNYNFTTIFFIIFSSVVRFGIYYLRAMTEENHLSQDKDYIEYKKKVKRKFIPGVF